MSVPPRPTISRSPPPPPPTPPPPRRTGAPRSRLATAAIGIVTVLVVGLGGAQLVRTFVHDLPSFPMFSEPGPSIASPSATEDAPTEDRTPEVRGRILDADGNPVPGATVRLVSAAEHALLRDTTSDPAGRFSFSRVNLQSIQVFAFHEPEGAVTSAALHARAGESLDVTLVLSPSAVHGQVVDSSEHPVAGASLSLGGPPWIARSVTSDDAGAFRIAALPDEATSLVVVARGYKTARVAIPRRDGVSDVEVRVRLDAASPVDGDVRDPDGAPLRGARIIACEGQPAETSATSNDDGTFQLPPTAIGCDAVARQDEYAPSDTVPVVEGGHISLRLRNGGAIEGVVVDERGKAIPSFTVGVEAFSTAQSRGAGSRGSKAFEDPGGAFRLEKLAPGSYVLTATASGRAPTRSDSIDVQAGGTTPGVRIVLAQGGSVVGHVFDAHHGPLGGVDLRFDAVSSTVDNNAATKTDDTGQYRLDGAPSGPFTLRVQKDGFRVRMLSGLRVDPAGTITQDVTLNAIDGGAGLEFGGIGANLSQTPEGVALSAVFSGDPADRAGLHPGDRIVRIDGEDADGMSLADILQRLRGPDGTAVGVTVQRGKGESIDVVIPRATIVR